VSELWAFNPLYTRSGLGGGSPAGTLIASVTIAASTAATPGLLPGGNSSARQIEFTNQTGSWAYINVGIQGSVTAATIATGYPIAPGGDKVISVCDEVTGWSVILAAGAAAGSVTATRGTGV
jgi:hypothetical protein